MGNSAGAISVGFHLFAPSSWGLFARAIMESGGPQVKGFELITSEEATKRSKDYLGGKNLGCDVTKSNEEILKCARELNASRLADENTGYYFVIDNDLFNKTIAELVKEKSFKKCNILTGFNADEFVLYFTTPILNFLKNDSTKWTQDWKNVNINNFNSTIEYFNRNEISNDNNFYTSLIREYFTSNDLTNLNSNISVIDFATYLNRIESDYIFICQSFNMAELFFSEKQNVYVYKYEYRISSSSFPESLASAIHVDELPIIFGEPLAIKVTFGG